MDGTGLRTVAGASRRGALLCCAMLCAVAVMSVGGCTKVHTIKFEENAPLYNGMPVEAYHAKWKKVIFWGWSSRERRLLVDGEWNEYDPWHYDWVSRPRTSIDPETGETRYESGKWDINVALLSLRPRIIVARSEDIDAHGNAMERSKFQIYHWLGNPLYKRSDEYIHDGCGAMRFTWNGLSSSRSSSLSFGSRVYVEGTIAEHGVIALLGRDDYVLRAFSGGDETFELMRHEGFSYTVRVEGQCVELSATPIDGGE